MTSSISSFIPILPEKISVNAARSIQAVMAMNKYPRSSRMQRPAPCLLPPRAQVFRKTAVDTTYCTASMPMPYHVLKQLGLGPYAPLPSSLFPASNSPMVPYTKPGLGTFPTVKSEHVWFGGDLEIYCQTSTNPPEYRVFLVHKLLEKYSNVFRRSLDRGDAQDWEEVKYTPDPRHFESITTIPRFSWILSLQATLPVGTRVDDAEHFLRAIYETA